MQNAVFQISLSKSSVDLINFTYFYEFRNDSMFVQLLFSLIFHNFLLLFIWWHLIKLNQLIVIVCNFFSRPRVQILQHVLLFLWIILFNLFLHHWLLWNILIFSIWTLLTWSVQLFLMYQTKAIIIVKFSNSKINFQIIFHGLILIDFIQEPFGKCTNNAFLVITYHILEKLIDKLNFKIS